MSVRQTHLLANVLRSLSMTPTPLLGLAVLLATTITASAATVTYTGTATIVVSRMSLPLVSGDSAVSATSVGVAAISTTPPTLLEMNCLGFGLHRIDETYAADFYCTLKAGTDDILDLKGIDGTGGGKVTIIGGSGKWRGATGTGTFTRVTATETDATSTFELEVITP